MLLPLVILLAFCSCASAVWQMPLRRPAPDSFRTEEPLSAAASPGDMGADAWTETMAETNTFTPTNYTVVKDCACRVQTAERLNLE